MYRTITCLTEEHSSWVIPLAVIVSWVSCHTALHLLGQARKTRTLGKLAWVAASGLSAGAGVWSTHFIGMLGYDPGFRIGYDPLITLLSLMLAIVIVLTAMLIAVSTRRLGPAALAGVIFGLGIVVTHFIGMVGVRVPGTLLWDWPLILAAALIGCASASAAFVFVSRNLSLSSHIVGATFLSASILGLHFLAMAAVKIVPDPSVAGWERELPRGAIALGIAVVMLLTLALAGLVLFVSRLQQINNALSERTAALRDKTELLDATLENMDQGLMMFDAHRVVRVCNERAISLLDLPPELMRAQPTFDAVREYQLSQDDYARSDEVLRRWFAERGTEWEPGVYERERPNGVVLEVRTVPLAGGGAVRTYTDITQRKAVETRIAHLARHDPLTNLPNRTLFRERLDQCLTDVHHMASECAVFWLDLDRFKVVNDTLGHLTGDALLREVAHRLQTALGPANIVARLGGDEFAVLVRNSLGPDHVAALAKHLIAAFTAPLMVLGQQVEVGLSIGIALVPQHGQDIDTVLKRADVALYRAKSEGRNTFRIFEPVMEKAEADRRALELDLRHAIDRHEFILHYQPQVRCATGEIGGFEALVRWNHPQRGLVPPSTFIPVAEETGLIVALGEWVLRTACAEAALWSKPLKLAVNLSPRQLHAEAFADSVLAILTETGLCPTRLELEVTETVMISDVDRTLSVLQGLQTIGIRIAMDDFGTGYSSLSTLQAFPFDRIKIDRSFVSKMEHSPEAAAIVQAVLGLGRSMAIQVTAEGVETAEQMRLLLKSSCDELQGYLLGRPQPICVGSEWLPLQYKRDAA